MTTSVVPHAARGSWPAFASWPRQFFLPAAFIVVTAVILFATPAKSLAIQWWTDPDAGHGLLLFPLSLWLAWRAGLSSESTPARGWGIFLLCSAIFFRALGGLAAEVYTQRFGMWLAIVGVIFYSRGWKQAVQWWLPLSLTLLSIPFPDLVMNRLALPLQRIASDVGTALMLWRGMPVITTGNIMTLSNPETGETMRLFVAEACSGLRSMTALLALAVAIGGMYLRTATSRIILLILSLPVAIFLNSLRVFLTSYLMYYVSKEFGDGFLHHSAGWGLFSVAMIALGIVAAFIRWGEVKFSKKAKAAND